VLVMDGVGDKSEKTSAPLRHVPWMVLLTLIVLSCWGYLIHGDAYRAANYYLRNDTLAHQRVGSTIYWQLMLSARGKSWQEKPEEQANFELLILADAGISLVSIDLAKHTGSWIVTDCDVALIGTCLSSEAAAAAAREFPKPVRSQEEYQRQMVEYQKKLAGYQSYQRAMTLKNQGQREKALEEFKKSIESDPALFNSYYYIDEILAANQQWDDIIEYWSRYIAAVPENGRAYLERGGAEHRKGDDSAAIRDAKKACELGESGGCDVVQRFQ
jgi:tetratricopeptide (TPR) repeat protein